jgi:translation elongation factor EF-G
MRKFVHCFAFLVLVPVFAVSVRAQETSKPTDSANRADEAKQAAHFYRLDFILEELDSAGKPSNSRSFSTTVSTAGMRSGTISAGSKIPLVTGQEDSKDKPGGPLTEFQYIDIGVKITASDVHEEGNHLAFDLHAVVSSEATNTLLAGVTEPVIHQTDWSGGVLIPIGKSTTLFKSDSLESKGSMQLKATATPEE